MVIRTLESKQLKTIPVKPDQLEKLFQLSSTLADLTEDLFEERGVYSQEFLRGLKRSLNEYKQGKITKVNSLQELL